MIGRNLKRALVTACAGGPEPEKEPPKEDAAGVKQ